MAGRALDPQENLACVIYVCGAPDVRGNMTEAYVQAGYSPNGNRATQAKSANTFFARDRIKLRVAQLAAQMQVRIIASNDDLLEALACIIHADPADAFDPATGELLPIHKMPKRFRCAISGWDTKTGRVQLHSKIAAIQTHGEWSGMNDKMLEKHINALPERARLERFVDLIAQGLQRNPAKTQTVEVGP